MISQRIEKLISKHIYKPQLNTLKLDPRATLMLNQEIDPYYLKKDFRGKITHIYGYQVIWENLAYPLSVELIKGE